MSMFTRCRLRWTCDQSLLIAVEYDHVVRHYLHEGSHQSIQTPLTHATPIIALTKGHLYRLQYRYTISDLTPSKKQPHID